MRPTRDPPSHPRSSYDPNLRRITMAPDASTYDRAHELAHQIQHRHQTLRWRLREAIPPWVPYLHRIATVLVELEANRLALGALHHAGLQTPATTAAGRNCIRYYLQQLFWGPTDHKPPLESAAIASSSHPAKPHIAERHPHVQRRRHGQM